MGRAPIPTGLPMPRVDSPELQRFVEAVFTRLANADAEIRRVAAEVSQMGRIVTTVSAAPTDQAGVPTLATPPTPTGVQVVCGIGFCMVSWVNPFRLYRNHGRALIYRHTEDRFDEATEIGQAEWLLYVDQDVATNGTEYFYWVRFESTTSVEGQPSDSASGIPAASPAALYQSMLDDLQADPNAGALTSDLDEPDVITGEIRQGAGLVALLAADAGRAASEVADDAQSRTVLSGANLGYGKVPGPAPHTFHGRTLAAAVAARDLYAAENPTWLQQYRSNENLAITLTYDIAA